MSACPHCGNPAETGAHFCLACEMPLSAAAAAATRDGFAEVDEPLIEADVPTDPLGPAVPQVPATPAATPAHDALAATPLSVDAPAHAAGQDDEVPSQIVSLAGAAPRGVDPLIGQQILGAYRIEKVLGRGGMSVVYRGKHQLTEQDVAIKVLPPDLASHREVKARFIEEARTLARLEHPNIVRLYNFAEEDGHLYLVMQFAEGESFDHIIEREARVAIADVVAIGIEVLRALDYAHERGVVHRDIKPSNIIIRGDSSVKVMDFGIAKIVGGSKLTQTGQTMGTVRYMSPEQVRGKQVDHRSDIYSLAVTLYEAACGRTPFDGDNHFDIMRKHLTELPPAPSSFVEVPQELEDALLMALEKRAERRHDTARDFRRALQKVPVDAEQRRLTRSVKLPRLDNSQVDAPARAVAPTEAKAAEGLDRPRPPRRVGPMLLALVLLLGAAGAVVWALLDDSKGRGSGRGTTAAVGSGRVRSVARVRRRIPWPKLHRVARGISKWAVDETDKSLRLHLLSRAARDTAPLKALYRRAKLAYRDYLRDEGVRVALRVGPLHLAVVDQKLLNNRDLWPGSKPTVDYPTRYFAPAGTLYVHSGAGFMRSDLPFGLALHFCARIPDRKLSNTRCYQLAEGFEKYLATHGSGARAAKPGSARGK